MAVRKKTPGADDWDFFFDPSINRVHAEPSQPRFRCPHPKKPSYDEEKQDSTTAARCKRKKEASAFGEKKKIKKKKRLRHCGESSVLWDRKSAAASAASGAPLPVTH